MLPLALVWLEPHLLPQALPNCPGRNSHHLSAPALPSGTCIWDKEEIEGTDRQRGGGRERVRRTDRKGGRKEPLKEGGTASVPNF